MSDHSAAAALVAGAIGFCFGLFVAFADQRWLGVPAGVAALMAGFLAYRISMTAVSQERKIDELTDEVTQLESAVADQIQARFAAETGVEIDDDTTAAETDAKVEASSPPSSEIASAELDVSAEEDKATFKKLTASAHPSAEDDDENLTDAVTGLFNEAYFAVTVEARISSARRHLRPVAVVMLDVVEGLEEGTPRQSDPSFIAERVIETIREADTACRMRDGRYALILEDTPENGAIWTVERLRRRLTAEKDGLTVWAGIACYPAHAFDTDEILSQSERALTAAREWHQDRIEVAEAQ